MNTSLCTFEKSRGEKQLELIKAKLFASQFLYDSSFLATIHINLLTSSGTQWRHLPPGPCRHLQNKVWIWVNTFYNVEYYKQTFQLKGLTPHKHWCIEPGFSPILHLHISVQEWSVNSIAFSDLWIEITDFHCFWSHPTTISTSRPVITVVWCLAKSKRHKGEVSPGAVFAVNHT